MYVVYLFGQGIDGRTVSGHSIDAYDVKAFVFDHFATGSDQKRNTFEIRTHRAVFQWNSCNHITIHCNHLIIIGDQCDQNIFDREIISKGPSTRL